MKQETTTKQTTKAERNNMAHATLTVAEGLAIQREHLAQWEAILKPEVFAKVKAIVDSKNARNDYVDGYDVIRGDGLTGIVYDVRNLFVAKAKATK